jgi:NADH-quinone oxidoreductase subunit J
MDALAITFYLFSSITVLSALRVITARNPVHSALFLVLTFFSCGAIWLLLQAEFLAITLVLVYVGAVMVLFLFVVMMLDINLDKVRKGFWKNLPVAALVGAVIVIEMAAVLFNMFSRVYQADAPQLPPDFSNTAALGRLIFNDYVYPLEIAAAILLVAMVAAIALTLRSRKDAKHQDPDEQVRVRPADRLSLLSMPAESKDR